MKLYLVRHGEATTEEINPEKPLTEKGEEQIRKITCVLENLDVKISALWHSSKRRARESAQILSKGLKVEDKLEQKSGLNPNDPVEPFKQNILEFKQDLMIIGHLPFLAKLAEVFLMAKTSEEIVTFPPGGVVCLEITENQLAKVSWSVMP